MASVVFPTPPVAVLNTSSSHLWPDSAKRCPGLRCDFSFSAAHFLGTASGLFLRPAASRLLLSRFLAEDQGVPPGMQPLALEAVALALGCPRKWGRKRRNVYVPQ